MAKRRPAGDGMVRKREDGRWEGRIVIGHKENGEPLFRHVYAKTQKALLDKLHQNIECYPRGVRREAEDADCGDESGDCGSAAAEGRGQR